MHRAATSLIMKMYLYTQAIVIHHPRYLLIALFARSSISRSTYISTTYISLLDRWVTQHCVKDLSNRTFYVTTYKTFFDKDSKKDSQDSNLHFRQTSLLPCRNLKSSALRNSWITIAQCRWKLIWKIIDMEKSDFTVTDRAHLLQVITARKLNR